MTDRGAGKEEPKHNQQRLMSALRTVRQRGVATSADVAAATALSTKRANAFINALRDEHVVDVAMQGRVDSRRSVKLRSDLACLIGIDLSLNQVRVAVADLDFQLLNRADATKVPIEQCDETLDMIARIAVREAVAHSNGRPVMGLGLGLPGPVSRDAGSAVSDHLLPPGWKDVPIATRLAERLEAHGLADLRVTVNNDASLGALGVLTRAAWMDPEQRPDDLVYVRVSSGIGMGLIMKGHLVTGANGFAGEIGHVRVKPDGPVCVRCSRKGCLEVMASEDAVIDVLRKHAWAHGLPGPVDLAAVAAATDAVTARELGKAGWELGFVLAGVVNVLNPTWIVLGGGLPEMPAYRKQIDAALDSYALEQGREQLRTLAWRTMYDRESGLDAGGGRDIGRRMTPELLGALAIVIDEFGDDFLQPFAFAAADRLTPG